MRRLALAVGLIVLSALATSGARAADDPTKAPPTTLSADGRTATDGQRKLTASKARDLRPETQSITVDGSGYNTDKGIYVAFCVIPPVPTQAPGPCGGGQDRTGQNGGAAWVSSNPPVYAAALTTRYGSNGSFKVQINVQAQLNETTDCRVVRCAVTSRNDHTRSSDRSQDILVPIYFQGGFGPPAPGTPGAPATTPPTVAGSASAAATTTTIAPALAAPLASVADDHLSISGGGKTLSAAAVRRLRRGDRLRVDGRGFDQARGVYIAVCAVPASPALPPGPCASGSAGRSAWVSSNPPDYGTNLAVPYAEGGAFSVTLTLDPVVDAEHDCAAIACAIATRNDDTNPDDRSQDLLLPVSFAANAPLPATRLGAETDDGGVPAAVVGTGVAAVAAIVGAALVLRKRRSRTGSEVA